MFAIHLTRYVLREDRVCGLLEGEVVRFLKSLYERSGLILCALAIATVLVLCALKPQVRSVLVAYDFGSQMFFEHQPLYDLKRAMGYLYAPAFAALYLPFYELGPTVGGLLWRVLGVGLLTAAVFTQAKKLDPEKDGWIVSLGLFLALPLSLGAVRNGQSTILLTAACWFLTMSALDNKRWQTLLWSFAALTAKPTAIVVILLIAALRPRLIPWIVGAVALMLAVPYAFAPAEYVNAQHLEFFQLLTSMSSNSAREAFEAADFTGILAAAGISITGPAAMIVRLSVAAIVLGAVFRLDRENEPLHRFVIFLIAAYYMTVFNPRVESNTYVMVAVPLGLAVAYLKTREPTSYVPTALGSMLFLCGWTGIDADLHAALNPWFKPMMVTLISVPLLFCLLQKVATLKLSIGKRI